MKIIHKPRAITEWVKAQQRSGKTVALVPTMGALHAGHISLIKEARRLADLVVVSIFVNPTQFGPGEDFDKYPRLFEQDCQNCRQNDVDLIFAPEVNDLYPRQQSCWVDEISLSEYLCGQSRPGHFKGVCTIVMKLFMICRPDVAVFGQKDAQQSLIIKRMVDDLNIDVKLHIAPIMREADGLAMSSRNAYLTKSQREQAKILSEALNHAEQWLRQSNDIASVKTQIINFINTAPEAKIDYVLIVDEETLKELEEYDQDKRVLVALAVHFGATRLIDNIRIP